MAVATRSALKTTISTNINDNTAGDVTPQDVRDPMTDMADSAAFLQEDLGKGSAVASAATVSLGLGWLFHITGTTTITDIDFTTPWDGRMAVVVFDGILTLTHNATTLVIPGGANIATAAGDRMLIVQDSGDNILVVQYTRASGQVLASLLSGTVADANLPARLQTTSETVTDANNATSSGFYDMASGGSNVPETSAYSIEVTALDSNNLVQIATAHATQRVWIRRKVSGTFGSWTILGGQLPGRSFSGTTDTLLATDAGGRVRSTGASAATITVPPNASVPIPVDHFITILQYGTGQVSVTAGVGVTIRSDNSKRKVRGQYCYGVLDKLGTDEWAWAGDIVS